MPPILSRDWDLGFLGPRCCSLGLPPIVLYPRPEHKINIALSEDALIPVVILNSLVKLATPNIVQSSGENARVISECWFYRWVSQSVCNYVCKFHLTIFIYIICILYINICRLCRRISSSQLYPQLGKKYVIFIDMFVFISNIPIFFLFVTRKFRSMLNLLNGVWDIQFNFRFWEDVSLRMKHI